jgi:hypothetical protein
MPSTRKFGFGKRIGLEFFLWSRDPRNLVGTDAVRVAKHGTGRFYESISKIALALIIVQQ